MNDKGDILSVRTEFIYKHRHFKRGATQEDILPVLEKAKQHFGGRRFSTTEYSEWRKINGGPTNTTIRKLFGSFENALSKVGIEKVPDHEVMEKVKGDLGRVISRTGYESWRKKHHYAPSSHLLCKNYGGNWDGVAFTFKFLAKKRSSSYSAINNIQSKTTHTSSC